MSRKVMLMAMVMVMVTLFAGTTAFGFLVKDSADFGFKYECDTLPSLSATPWDIAQADTTVETTYASTDGDILSLDTYPTGAVSWWLPGQWGAESAPLANRHYTQGDASNPWNGNPATGYTVELSIKVENTADYAYGLSLWLLEGNSGCGADIQFFKDKITSTRNSTTMYTGDLSDGQHIVRIVRTVGGYYSTPTPELLLYVDGVHVYTAGISTEPGGIMIPTAWNQDALLLGNLAGGAHYEAQIDYIRADFTGAYVPEPATMALLACGAVALIRRKK